MIDILYEDNHLLIAKKPFGIATQREPDGTLGLQEEIQNFIKQRDSKPGNVFLHAVHRLDKPVCGLVVFAKSQKALSRCSESLRNRLWMKEYSALVEGKVTKRGEVAHYLTQTKDCAIATTYKPDKSSEKSPQLALLEILDSNPSGAHTLVLIRLISGRHHQIRAQLSALNTPILGDRRYGARENFKPYAIALVHSRVEFPHPVLDSVISISFPPEFGI